MKTKTSESTQLCYKLLSKLGCSEPQKKSAAKGQESSPDDFSILAPQPTTGNVEGYG